MALLAWIVEWALRHRGAVLVLTTIFACFGVRGAFTLPIDAVPDVTNVQVQIVTTSPALSPVEMEQYVTIPVERAMAGLPHTTELRSLSKYGISLVTIVFRDGTDIYFARQLVSERMREARDAIPAEYGKPQMGPITTGLGEIYQFVVDNDALSLMQKEELLDWYIAPQLRTVPGVIEVNSQGGENKEYQVVLDPKRLQAAGLAIGDVVAALEKANANAGGGYIEHNREHFVIGTNGLVRSLEDLQRVVVSATPQGMPITIGAIGDVQFGPRMRTGASTHDGKGEIVAGVAMMLMGENSRTVTEAVKAKLAELVPTLPPGTRIVPYYDRSTLVDRTIKTVGTNLFEGALLVVAVLFLLLGDFRGGLVVAATIPLAMLFAVILMNAAGVSGNLMSLGAIDFGLIVDGAVIVVENAVRHLTDEQRLRGRELTPSERLEVVRRSTLEVRSATVFGELIIAIVYVPLFALAGTEAKLFRPMASTVLFALAGAFVVSLTVVPVLTSLLVRPKKSAHDTWLLRKAHAAYVPLLGHTLRHRWVTLTVGVALLTGAALLATRLGAEFVPQLDEGDLLLEARRLPGVSLTESLATEGRLERALMKTPEILHVVGRTGAPEIATDPMGLEQTDVYIELKPRAEWRQGLTKEALAEELSTAARENVPEIGAAMSQPIQMRTNELLSGVRSDVAAIVYGRDLEELRRAGDRVAAAIARVPGAVDVRVEQVAGLKYLRITPDRTKLARYGLSVADVNLVTETMAVGRVVGPVFEGERRFDLTVKTRSGFNGDLDALRALPMRSVSGQIVPLGDVASLELSDGPVQVNRDKQSRRIIVEFNVRNRDLVSVVEGARAAVGRGANIAPGYRVEWGGKFEHYEQARNRLLVVVPVALVLILWLLYLAFYSARPALLIFANVPFAAIGGVAALWVRGIPFSISAGVGFIALFGVAVLNGLVLVSFSRRLEEGGVPHVDAIRQASELRLRPVLMTALVASLGFVPMALSTAPGSEVQRPLATVVVGGLFSATLLTLFLLPVLYAYFGGSRARQAAPSSRFAFDPSTGGAR
jgi:cobalt-zinc-cadmium resistance protein CzcA